jgi:rubrerythrin
MGWGLVDAFRRDRTEVVAECRRCGTSADRDATTCPVCDADAIVTYRIR